MATGYSHVLVFTPGETVIAPNAFRVRSIRGSDEIIASKSVADKPVASKNGIHAQLLPLFPIRFNNVAQRTQGESFLYHIGRGFLTHEEYFAFERFRIRRAASIPFRFGSPMSSNQVRL